MLTVLLCVAVAPAVICGVILVATGALKPAADARLRWSIPIAVALGVTVAELGGGTQHVPPIEASDWFIPIAVAIAVIAVVRDAIPAWPLRIVVAIAVVGLVCKPLFAGAWTLGEGLAWCAGMVAAIAVSWWGVDRAAVVPGFGVPAAMLIVSTGAAVSVVAAGSAHYGQTIGAVASALGPVMLLGFVRRDVPLLRTAWVPYVVVATVLVASLTFVDVPTSACMLLMLAFLALPLADLGVLQARPRWQREVLRIGVSIALVVVAVIIALPQQSEAGY